MSGSIPNGRWDDNEVKDHISRKDISPLLVTENEYYFVDTSQCFHCGSGWSNKERYILIIALVPPLANVFLGSKFIKEKQMKNKNIDMKIMDYFNGKTVKL